MGCNSSLLNQQSQLLNGKDNLHNRMKVFYPTNGQSQKLKKTKIYENVNIDCINKTQYLQILNQALSKHSLFYKLSSQERLELISIMVGYKAQKGTIIFHKGDLASLFFIIAQGVVSIQLDNGQKILKKGQYFGQLALLYTAPRSATAKVMENSKFWCLSQFQFKNALQNLVKKNYQISKNYIHNMELFKFIPKNIKDTISYKALSIKYSMNQTIFKIGDPANSFFIIINGQVQIIFQNKKGRFLNAGESFGENSLKDNQYRFGTAKAVTQVNCLCFNQQAIKQSIGGQFQQLLFFNITKWALKQSILFQKIPTSLAQKIANLLEIKIYNDNQIICKEGLAFKYFVICLQGKINGKQIGTIFHQDLVQNSTDKLKQTLKKQGDGFVGIINCSRIQNLIGKTIKQLYHSPILEQQQPQYKPLTIKQIKQQNIKKLTFDNLMIVKKIGQGKLSKVYLVQIQEKIKVQRYVLKCISKNKIINQQIQNLIKRQKQILDIIKFPFIIQLEKTYKNQYYIFFLIKFIQGQNLYNIIKQTGLLSINITKFFISCLITTLQYLHLKNIVYRDIKPENGIVDDKGYLHLIDFKTAKVLKEENGYRTFTIIGTPHYMAPQILQGKGYSFSTDRWALGIMLYQMLFGIFPYGENTSDAYQIFQQIQKKKEIKIPQCKNQQVIDLIQLFLNKNPTLRSKLKWKDIKKLNIFSDIDWQKLVTKQMKAPYRPKKKNIKLNKNNSSQLETVRQYINELAKQQGDPIISKKIDWDSIF